MKSLWSRIWRKFDNFRRKFWTAVYLYAGKRVDRDELWDPIFKAEVKRRLQDIAQVYGLRMARALTHDPLADYPYRELRDHVREHRDYRP